MKKIIHLMMLLLMLSTGCVSIKQARNIDKAEKKILKFNTGIQNQINKYPELIDKAYTFTVYDTIIIESNSAKVNAVLNNIDFLDSLNTEFEINSDESKILLDSILSSVNNNLNKTGNKELDSALLVHKENINLLGSNLINLQFENDKLFELYQNEILKETVGTFTDSTFIVDYKYSNGVIDINIKTKEQYKVVPVEVNDFTIKAKRHFYQDFKFYGFLIILFNLLYFLGAEIQIVLKKIVESTLKLIRKLFTGI